MRLRIGHLLLVSATDPRVPSCGLNLRRERGDRLGAAHARRPISPPSAREPGDGMSVVSPSGAARLAVANRLACRFTHDAASVASRSTFGWVSYTHLTLPTNREV